ncbi:MAG: AbrB/MazE/SpoVT family DNA-binding domain-containing protein [Chloroflexi bacterium]|nr:AbrB/MazE/SpoVT family DNA-binding domain-containing protein [Chloroflexota bacterium]
MASATVTSKGQVVIPVEIRKKLDIKKGTRIYFEERGDEVVLRAINRKYIKSLVGIFAGHDLAKGLLEDRAEDKRKEENDDEKGHGRLRSLSVAGKRARL